MKIKLAKKIPCEVEVFNGGKVIDKYIAMGNEPVAKTDPEHGPIKDIDKYKNRMMHGSLNGRGAG